MKSLSRGQDPADAHLAALRRAPRRAGRRAASRPSCVEVSSVGDGVDDGDAVLAPLRRRRGAVHAVDLPRACRRTCWRIGVLRRRTSCGSSAPAPMPERSSATRPCLASPGLAIVSASAVPRRRPPAAMISSEQRDDRARSPASARWWTIVCAQRVHARLARCVGAPVRPVEPRAPLRQHDRQQRQRHQRRDERDQQPAVADAAQERQRQRDEREQADRDGGAAEDDGAPGGLHRALRPPRRPRGRCARSSRQRTTMSSE